MPAPAQPRERQGPELTAFAHEYGVFRVERPVPGEWIAYPRHESTPQTDLYGENCHVTVGTAEGSGLEIHLRRGATIAGTIVVDGAAEDAAPPPHEVTVRPEDFADDLVVGAWPFALVGPDGRFTLTGLRAAVSLTLPKREAGYDSISSFFGGRPLE